MKRMISPLIFAAIPAAALTLIPRTYAQGALQVTFGAQGVQRVSYQGAVLEDLSRTPDDTFHIWHMKATDLKGKLLTQGQYGWGENNSGRHWDAATRTWTYQFTWGAIAVRYTQTGDTLEIAVETKNNANSGIIFDGATVAPLTLHFPAQPAGFAGAPLHIASNTGAPSVTLANYGSGEVAAVVPEAKHPLYSGFQAAKAPYTYTAIISGTTPDGVPSFFPHRDSPLMPGQSDVETVVLHFAPAGTPMARLGADAYRSWARAWPPTLHWSDRRIIGTVYLASSPAGNTSQAGGYPNNPRRYFNDRNAADFDVRTAAGLRAFQARVLAQAETNVGGLRRLHAQAAITWDIEGEQFPQPTSYACAPDQIAKLAPEMESTVDIPGSPYKGMKVDDAYFKTMRAAGFRVGVCVRPQRFALAADGTARQVSVADQEAYSELLRKMKFAHDRWGATVFYVDSSVEADGAPLPAELFAKLAAAMPDSLIAPEESTPKAYAYTAPFRSFLFHTDLGTDAEIHNYYPHAFSLNLVNDVAPAKLRQYRDELVRSVRRGDVLMVHADYWQANNEPVMQIYAAAGGAK